MAEDTAEKQTKKEFEEAQKREAEAQNLGDGAVPEQRPQAFVEAGDSTSDLTRHLEDEEVINTEPMDKAAYDRADSDAQRKKAEKDESQEQGFYLGSFWRVTKGPHEGRVVALTRIVRWASDEDRLQVVLGSKSRDQIRPAEIEGRDRGSDRDGELLILDVEEAGLERVGAGHWSGVPRG